MRLCRIFTHVTRLKILPKKVLSGAYMRYCILLVLVSSFILAYFVSITLHPIKTLPVEKDVSSFHLAKKGYSSTIKKFVSTNFTAPPEKAHKSSVNESVSDDDLEDLEQDQDAAAGHTIRKPAAIVPIRCDPSLQVSEVLRMRPLKFLTRFKNPCWRERIETAIEVIYDNNGFAKYSYSYETALKKMLKKRLKMGKKNLIRLRCLPYFFLAGQPKCGSTDFYNKIVSHPDIMSPPNKESHWWGKNRYGWCFNYTENIPFKDYVDLYDDAAMKIRKSMDLTLVRGHRMHSAIAVDGSVSTLWSNDDWWKNPENCGLLEPKYTNANHIYSVLPQARIIVILRNPTDRLYSDFLFFPTPSKSKQYFHEEVKLAINALNECVPLVGIRACIYNSTIAGKSKVRLRLGLYEVYLHEWLALFPRRQILVVRLEDYAVRTLEIVKQAHKFLDLKPLTDEEYEELLSKTFVDSRRASDKSYGSMLPETRALLDNFYKPFNVKLAKLLKDDRFLWNAA